MSKKRLAIIGAGIIAEAHVAAAAESSRVAIAAVVDPVTDRSHALAQRVGAKPFASVDRLLADDKARASLDAVLICTPPSVRQEPAEAALRAGLPVMVEKPLANSVNHAQSLVNLSSRRPHTPTAVAFCHRFTPAIRRMKEMLQRGDLGTPVRFENTFACWHPKMRDHWMSDPDISGGGSLVDTGCHAVDIFHYLIGPSQTDAAVLSHRWPGRGDSNATLLIHHGGAVAGGTPVAGILSSGWAEPARFTVAVVGTEGLLHYDFEKPEELLWSRSTGPAETLKVQTHEVRFRHQLEAFADLIDNPSAPTELASFEDGLAVAVTLQDAREQVVGF